MSWPVYSSKGTKADDVSVASVAPTYPGTITAGDLLLIIGFIEDTTGTISTPTGYTNAQDHVQTGIALNIGSYLFYKIATGSESGTETVSGATLSGGVADYLFAQIYRITGTNITFSEVDSRKETSDITGVTTWNEVTVGSANSTLLALILNYDTASDPSVPTGYTSKAIDTAIGGTPTLSVELNSLENTASGSSVTGSGGSEVWWATYHISIYNSIVTASRSFIVN